MRSVLKNKKIKDFIFINIGVMGLALSFSFLLSPFELVTGGMGGIAINVLNILEKWFKISINPDMVSLFESIIILSLNSLLLLISLFLIGKEFFFKTLYCSIAYPVFVGLFGMLYKVIDFGSLLPVDTSNIGNIFVIVLFSSILSGVSIGLAIKHGASTGGVDIIEQINLKYFNIPYSTTLLMVDGIIVLVASILTTNVYPILYGIIYIYISGHLIDSVVFGGFQSYNVSIITSRSEMVKKIIIENINRGLTVVDAVGGYTGQDLKMIVCVMSSSEVSKLRGKIKEIDQDAFLFVTRTQEVSGIGFTKERD